MPQEEASGWILNDSAVGAGLADGKALMHQSVDCLLT